jgi:hypothetical protein
VCNAILKGIKDVIKLILSKYVWRGLHLFHHVGEQAIFCPFWDFYISRGERRASTKYNRLK